MTTGNPFQEILQEIAKIRTEKGEDEWRRFSREIVNKMRARGPNGLKTAKNLLGDAIDPAIWDEVEAPKEAPPAQAPETPVPPPLVLPTDAEAGKPFVDAVRGGLPDLRTQAEYESVVGAFGALRNLVAALLAGDKTQATKAEEGLRLAVGAVKMAKEFSDKLRDVPEAATSEAAEAFKRPPPQFKEEAIQKELLVELTSIQELETLAEWYGRKKPERDSVVTPQLRNSLYDAIRAKRSELSR